MIVEAVELCCCGWRGYPPGRASGFQAGDPGSNDRFLEWGCEGGAEWNVVERTGWWRLEV